jgi:hypothetical protein
MAPIRPLLPCFSSNGNRFGISYIYQQYPGTPPRAQAACLTTVGENVCATFDASTPSTAVQPFASQNLQTNRYF